MVYDPNDFTKHQLFFQFGLMCVCWRHGFGMYRIRTNALNIIIDFFRFILDSIALFPYKVERTHILYIQFSH